MKIIIKILLRILAEQKKQNLMVEETVKAINDLTCAIQDLESRIQMKF